MRLSHPYLDFLEMEEHQMTIDGILLLLFLSFFFLCSDLVTDTTSFRHPLSPA